MEAHSRWLLSFSDEVRQSAPSFAISILLLLAPSTLTMLVLPGEASTNSVVKVGISTTRGKGVCRAMFMLLAGYAQVVTAVAGMTDERGL